MSTIKEDLNTIAAAIANSNPGFMLREAAKAALGRVREHIAFDRTQREYMEADFKALAEGQPVKTALAKAVEARIEALQKPPTSCRCGRALEGGSVNGACAVCWNAQ